MSDGLILLMALMSILIVLLLVYISKKRISAEEVKDTNQIKDLRLELEKVKSELSQITDPKKGDIYNYNYWFDIIETRVKDPIQDESNLSRSINGHYEEYHYRMIESINYDKIKFIKPRLICFLEIFNRLKELENFNFTTSDDTILFSKYLFHSKASLYSAVKFILLDLTSGKMMLDKLYPDYDTSLLENKIDDNESDELSKVSLETLSKLLRLNLNLNIKQKANDLIDEKNTTAYVYLIKIIDSSFSISDANDSEIKMPPIPINQDVFDEIKNLDVKQQEYIERCFSGLILWCDNFKFQSLIIYLIDLCNRTNIKLSSDLDEILESISNNSQKSDSSASRICTSCANPIELSENFCDKCGNKVGDDKEIELDLNLHENSKIESTSNSPEQEVPLSEFIDDNGIEETLEKIQNDEKEIVISLKISNRNGLLSCKCDKNNLELLDKKRIGEFLSQYDVDSAIKVDELTKSLKVINPLFWDSIGRAIVSKTESINYLTSFIDNDGEYEDIDDLIQDYIIEDCSHAYVENYFEQEKWEAIETSKFCDGCSEFDLISDGMVEGIEHETIIRNKATTKIKVENQSSQESTKDERVINFCTNCGERIAIGDKFCLKCGDKINK